MKFTIILLSYLFTFSLSASSPNDIMVTYRDGSKKITISRKQFYDKLGPNKKKALSNKSTQKSSLLDMVIKRLALLEARKLGLHKKPAFKLELKEYIDKRVLIAALFQIRFPRNKDFNYKIKLYRTRHIFLRIKGNNKKAKKSKRAKMLRILRQLKTKGIFPKLARQYGEDGSAKLGGKLGLLSAFHRGYEKPFLNAACALSPGQVSGIVETKFGLHIIKCDEIVIMTPAKFRKLFPKSDDMEKKQKRRKLKGNLWYTAVWQWIDHTLKNSMHIKYNPGQITRGKEDRPFLKILNPEYSYSVTTTELRKVMRKLSVDILKKRFGITRKKNSSRPFSFKELRLYHKWHMSFAVLKYGAVINNVKATSYYKKRVTEAEKSILTKMLKKQLPEYKTVLLKKYGVIFYGE